MTGVRPMWTEFSAQRGYWQIADEKKLQNPNKLVVAATFEMPHQYTFLRASEKIRTAARILL